MSDPRIRWLREQLRGHPSRRLDRGFGGAWAGVALIVRAAPIDLELLLIRRAAREGDLWSGHTAFPGGRASPRDRGLVQTAIRETGEEVGIDLREPGLLLGGLDEVEPRSAAPRIGVAPFVFGVAADTETRLNHEVESSAWVPLRELAAPDARTEHLHRAEGRELRFPALLCRGYTVWGLTHRILLQFLEIAAHHQN